MRICLQLSLQPYPGSTIARVGLPSCVTPLLAYYQIGSRTSTSQPEGLHALVLLAFLDSALTRRRGYGNINPLSIDYACRPHLRSRLTQGGLAWPWNPWSFGGQGSHLPYRYSCLHSHSCGVHGWVTPPLRSPHDAPLPIHTPEPRRLGYCMNDTASAVCLSPATLSARNHLTSELLRTLLRVAASKPTSWLSVRLHILSHLAHAWGP